MATNQDLCQTINPETSTACNASGSEKEMNYFLTPDGCAIKTCPTCTPTLAAGFKAAGLRFQHAPIVTVRRLAKFAIELVSELQIVEGHCSFAACGNELSKADVMVLRHGKTRRRICQTCASALKIVSKRAQTRLEDDKAGTEKLAKAARPHVEREALLVPETIWAADKAIQELLGKEKATLDKAKALAMANLKPAIKSAPAKPQSATPQKATPAAQPKPASTPAIRAKEPSKADIRRRDLKDAARILADAVVGNAMNVSDEDGVVQAPMPSTESKPLHVSTGQFANTPFANLLHKPGATA